MSATADSGLPVSFTSSDGAVVSVDANSLTVVGIGTTSVTASQSGNDNYLAAPSVARTASVTNLIAWLSIGTDTNHYYLVSHVYHVTTNRIEHTSEDYYVTNSVPVYTNMALTVHGNADREYRIEYTDTLAPTNWKPLMTITNLPSASYLLSDPMIQGKRFYRLIRRVWSPDE